MSTNSNFRKEKCWSCEFYCGQREYKKGFLGDSICTGGKGLCSNKCSSKSGKTVYEDNWCSKYKKWSVIVIEEQKREAQRLQQEERRRKYELEQERKKLELERQRLEYERWYNSLSPEEKRREDTKKAIQRNEENKRKAEEAQRKEIRRAKNKKFRIIGVIFAVVIAVTIFSIGPITKIVNENKFANSDTGKLVALIQKENYGKNKFYFSVDRNEGCKSYFGFEYEKNGWIDEFGLTRDFRVYCQLTPRSVDHYNSTTGFCFFNLEGSDNVKKGYLNGNGACFTSYTEYGLYSSVITQYKINTSSSSLRQVVMYDSFKKWDNTYDDNQNEWRNRGYKACELVNTLINQYCIVAFGSPFWK